MLKQNAATSADSPTNAHPVRRPSRLTTSSVTFTVVVPFAPSTSAMSLESPNRQLYKFYERAASGRPSMDARANERLERRRLRSFVRARSRRVAVASFARARVGTRRCAPEGRGEQKKDIFEAVFPLGGDAGAGTRETSARRVGMGNNDTPWDRATRVDGWMR